MAFKYMRCLLLAILGASLFVENNYVRGGEVDVVVRPTKMWSFLGMNDEMVPQRFRENVDEFSVGRIKCLRYCVESKAAIDDMPQIVHLVWKFDKMHQMEMESATISDKNFKPEILQAKSIESDDPEKLQNKCTFSIVIGCEIPQGLDDNISAKEKNFIKSLQPNLDILKDSGDNGSSALNFVNEKLVDETDLTNETEISFQVKRDQEEINAIVLGNIAKIDLKMPIGHGETPQLTLSAARGGVRLTVHDPPPGGWRLGARGESRLHRLTVAASTRRAAGMDYFDTGAEIPMIENDLQSTHKNSGISPRQIKVLYDNDDQTSASDNSAVNHEFSARMISDNHSSNEKNEQIPFKFPSINKDVEIVIPTHNITMRMDTEEIEDRSIDRQATELEDLSRSLNEELPIKRFLIVDVNPNTNLIANPGTIHRINFDITNSHVLTIRHYFAFRSTPLRVVGIRPPYGYVEIAPGQTATIGVDIQVPPTVTESLINTVTLQVQGLENLQKSAHLYVKTTGSRINDDTRPTVYYYFNNNCNGRTSAEKCLKSHWSVDITVQDSESGLKSVTSAPKGVYPRSEYISGTTSPVYLYYSNNCCNRVVEVTATDLAGNVYSRKIDVGEWYNLSKGEIAAIVVGTLFLILLIIFIVLLIVYCCNNRKSEDLPYSQRYGSRSTPRTE